MQSLTAHFQTFFVIANFALAICLAAPAHAEKRVALVIGNAAYQNTPALTNPVNDGEDLATALRKIGFTVVLERNLTKRGMEGAIARFARMSQDADTALFFYAGHGMQWRGLNYLVPIDAKMEDEFNITFELTRLDDVLLGLERTRGVKILVLDACRNNPLLDRLNRTSNTRDLGSARGFAKIETTRGMVIAYSTQFNQVAVDGTGRNSPFTKALVKEIDEPGLEIGTMFRRVAAQVNKMTEGRQLPELSVSLLGEFYLNNQESDWQSWRKIVKTNPAQLKDFIARYPSSDFVPLAQQHLDSAERARVERERIERERIEKEQLAREQAERERLAKEQAARDKAQREQVEREALEREKIARKQADRENRISETADKFKIASLPPMVPNSAEATLSGGTLIQEIKKELKRVGCYSGNIDDKWDSAHAKFALQKFAKHAKLQTSLEPNVEFLTTLRNSGNRICPAECRVTEKEVDGRCIVKTCPQGSVLGEDGNCKESKARSAARSPTSADTTLRSRSGVKDQVYCDKAGCRSVTVSSQPIGNNCVHRRGKYLCQ